MLCAGCDLWKLKVDLYRFHLGLNILVRQLTNMSFMSLKLNIYTNCKNDKSSSRNHWEFSGKVHSNALLCSENENEKVITKMHEILGNLLCNSKPNAQLN